MAGSVARSPSTALGAEDSVPWDYQPDAHTALQSLATAGYHIVAVETSREAVNLFEWTPRWPICLVFGHEVDGVSSDLAAHVETVIRIPMLGEKRSLNVATAAGVVLYELLRLRLYRR
jgi:23S rRNA (guanosine2251-2'-O)-methyltransferase